MAASKNVEDDQSKKVAKIAEKKSPTFEFTNPKKPPTPEQKKALAILNKAVDKVYQAVEPFRKEWSAQEVTSAETEVKQQASKILKMLAVEVEAQNVKKRADSKGVMDSKFLARLDAGTLKYAVELIEQAAMDGIAKAHGKKSALVKVGQDGRTVNGEKYFVSEDKDRAYIRDSYAGALAGLTQKQRAERYTLLENGVLVEGMDLTQSATKEVVSGKISDPNATEKAKVRQQTKLITMGDGEDVPKMQRGTASGIVEVTKAQKRGPRTQ
ncbi:MAG TPA: hypothetical protein VM532_16575 [Burkholderiales bacterium]|nr:hypothetical protein [Burkholderiales bacterium]